MVAQVEGVIQADVLIFKPNTKYIYAIYPLYVWYNRWVRSITHSSLNSILYNKRVYKRVAGAIRDTRLLLCYRNLAPNLWFFRKCSNRFGTSWVSFSTPSGLFLFCGRANLLLDIVMVWCYLYRVRARVK